MPPRREHRRIPVGQLTVDLTIRPDLPPEWWPNLPPSEVGHLYQHYDRRELGMFVVSQRADGTLAVIDGARRHKVATTRESPDFEVECWVYTDLTLDQETAMATALNGV